MRQKELAQLWLYGDDTLSKKISRYLMMKYGSSFTAWEESAHALEKTLSEKFEKEEYQSLLLRKNIDYMEMQYGRLKERNIFLLYPEHALYPEKLTHIYDKPMLLYARGTVRESINYHNQSVAVVGARNADCYYRETTRIFTRELAKRGIQIISGLAKGIDGEAHRGCLEADGYTVAVLGGGINVTYPREHVDLFLTIEQHGLILSEYGLDVPPASYHFPLRNRIISGLSDGVFVICAKKKSGSLITADYALEQGKQVYAMPGRVLDALSEGSNHLIQMGAMCVTRPNDILLDFWGEERLYEGETGIQNLQDEKNCLAPAEKMVYSLLGLDPVHVDDIIAHANMSVSSAINVLYGLENKKLIKQPMHGYYIKNL